MQNQLFAPKRSLPDTLQDMCHPAIADSRIMYFDDKAVAFYYIDTKTKRKIDVVMKIEDFMLALLQHIPDRQFKMIRHYGTYSRRTKKIYAKHLRRSINNCKPENLIKIAE